MEKMSKLALQEEINAMRLAASKDLADAFKDADPDMEVEEPVQNPRDERMAQRLKEREELHIQHPDIFLMIQHKGKLQGPDDLVEDAEFELEINIDDFREGPCRWGDVMTELRQILDGQLGESEGAGLVCNGTKLSKDDTVAGSGDSDDGPEDYEQLEFITVEEGGYTSDELTGYDRRKHKLTVMERFKPKVRFFCLTAPPTTTGFAA